MWLVFAGRLYKEFEDAIGEYSEVDVKGYEMVEDYGKEKEDGVTCIVILDAGLHSLKEWKDVHNLNKVYMDVPIILYVRNKEFIPDRDIFKDNVDVRLVEDVIYINALVKEVEELEKKEEGKEWGED